MSTRPKLERPKRSFRLGCKCTTQAALEAIQKSGQDPEQFVRRHAAGDFGDVSEEVKELNESAIKENDTIISVYQTKLGQTIWVVTDCFRTETVILLPAEY
jgi:hypothetical protein